jgi:hypothetical protein
LSRRDTPYRGQRVGDQVIHAIGRIGSGRDFAHQACLQSSPASAIIKIGDTIEAGVGARMVGEELRQPFRHLLHRGIGIAILVQEIAMPWISKPR